jgi:hypothetical protein
VTTAFAVAAAATVAGETGRSATAARVAAADEALRAFVNPSCHV